MLSLSLLEFLLINFFCLIKAQFWMIENHSCFFCIYIVLKLVPNKKKYQIYNIQSSLAVHKPRQEIVHKILCSNNNSVFLKTFEKSERVTLLFWVELQKKIVFIEYSLIKLGYGFHNIYFPSSQVLFTVLNVSILYNNFEITFQKFQ